MGSCKCLHYSLLKFGAGMSYSNEQLTFLCSEKDGGDFSTRCLVIHLQEFSGPFSPAEARDKKGNLPRMPLEIMLFISNPIDCHPRLWRTPPIQDKQSEYYRAVLSKGSIMWAICINKKNFPVATSKKKKQQVNVIVITYLISHDMSMIFTFQCVKIEILMRYFIFFLA